MFLGLLLPQHCYPLVFKPPRAHPSASRSTELFRTCSDAWHGGCSRAKCFTTLEREISCVPLDALRGPADLSVMIQFMRRGQARYTQRVVVKQYSASYILLLLHHTGLRHPPPSHRSGILGLGLRLGIAPASTPASHQPLVSSALAIQFTKK